MQWLPSSLLGKQQKNSPAGRPTEPVPLNSLKYLCFRKTTSIPRQRKPYLPTISATMEVRSTVLWNTGENIRRMVWIDGGSSYLLLFAFEILVLAFSRHSLARQQSKIHPEIVEDVGFQNDHKALAATKMLVFELNVHFDHRAKFSQQDQYGS